jgi:hypothetical protein
MFSSVASTDVSKLFDTSSAYATAPNISAANNIPMISDHRARLLNCFGVAISSFPSLSCIHPERAASF